MPNWNPGQVRRFFLPCYRNPDDGNDGLPQFPSSPGGLARMKHLPTVEASIHYWEAVRVHAVRACNSALEWTAISLRSSYEHAREELRKAEPPQKTMAAPCAQHRRVADRT